MPRAEARESRIVGALTALGSLFGAGGSCVGAGADNALTTTLRFRADAVPTCIVRSAAMRIRALGRSPALLEGRLLLAAIVPTAGQEPLQGCYEAILRDCVAPAQGRRRQCQCAPR